MTRSTSKDGAQEPTDWTRVDRSPGASYRVALCVPMNGIEGIWGPSALASAQLGQIELNRCNGIAGRPCELVVVDASNDANELEQTLTELVARGEVDALVGMHLSSVRERILSAVGGQVPYVYTCLYEGGAAAPGLFAIGETAARQLNPAIQTLSELSSVRRWALIGNDYIWPRASHTIAKRVISATGGRAVVEQFLPFGQADYSQVFEQLRSARCDAVLVSMIGQDAIEFNRAFSAAGLATQMLRLSCAIEENQLLAIGADHTEGLYVSLGYFGALDTDENRAFKEQYHSQFGARAPTLNALGQSLYEGMHFLGALLDPAQAKSTGGGAPFSHQSARYRHHSRRHPIEPPIYLAAADGHQFEVLERFCT